MYVAILGWGSLLWEDHLEFNRQHEPWQCDGPELKIEFSRVSSSRLRALTLVIDENHGTAMRVAYCMSRRDAICDAVGDLRTREGTRAEMIGRLVLGEQDAETGEARTHIREWAQTKTGIDAVVWTGLSSNFREEANVEFSNEAALDWVRRLPAAGKVKAAEYVWLAPAFVQTPLRAALQGEPWFPHSQEESRP
jgi:hypothetical protein